VLRTALTPYRGRGLVLGSTFTLCDKTRHALRAWLLDPRKAKDDNSSKCSANIRAGRGHATMQEGGFRWQARGAVRDSVQHEAMLPRLEPLVKRSVGTVVLGFVVPVFPLVHVLTSLARPTKASDEAHFSPYFYSRYRCDSQNNCDTKTHSVYSQQLLIRLTRARRAVPHRATSLAVPIGECLCIS
jgi:hypothetical protein